MTAVPDDEPSSGLAGQVFLFLHAGGLPVQAIAHQLAALRCLGQPDAFFDLEGSMWSALKTTTYESFDDYLLSLVDRGNEPAGRLSAIIDYRDLLWLEQRPLFQEQLRQRLRVARLTFLDPALQACRRVEASTSKPGEKPGFAAIARALVEIEEAEEQGGIFFRRHALPSVRLRVEDLARPSVPALKELLTRWSIRLPDDGSVTPIPSPSHEELETVAAFRAEATKRHWAHALRPKLA